MRTSVQSTPTRKGGPPAEERLQALLRQAVEGNAPAFEDLYRLSIRSLLPHMQRICGAHTEDVLAETYFQAWRTLDTFDAHRSSVLGWLLIIARSRARDRMRLERTRHGGMDGAIPFEPDCEPHDGVGPEEEVSASQERQRLIAALAKLNPAQRWVIGLAYYCDHSHTEISVLTGLPLGTVKTLIQRSHKHLRGMMQPEARTSLPRHYAAATAS